MALLVTVAALGALALGLGVGAGLTPRILERRQRRAITEAGVTVSQMLQHVVTLAPIGIVVVDRMRDVVFINDRAVELAWCVTGCSTSGPGRLPSTRWPPVRMSRSICRPRGEPLPAAPDCRCADTCGC